MPADFVLPAELTIGQPDRMRYDGRLHLAARYFDTADFRLAREGITLRHRTGEAEPLWTLKVPSPGGKRGDRVERSVPAAEDSPPPDLVELLTGHLRGDELVDVAQLRTERDVWLIAATDGKVQVELVDDQVTVSRDGSTTASWRELEVELKTETSAAAETAAEVIKQLEALGAAQSADPSKLARAVGVSPGTDPSVPMPVRVRKKDSARALVVAQLRADVRRLIAQDIAVRVGQDDAVHQMRVACRRLRSDLRTFGSLFAEGSTDRLRAELGWLATSLGDARDLEVLRARLALTFTSDPLVRLDPVVFARLDEFFRRRQQAALDQVTEALATQRYVDVLTLAVATARRPSTTERAEGTVRKVLPPLVAHAVGKVDRAVRVLTPDAPDAVWHAARIRAKRARYAAEACERAVGKPADRTAAAMASVQKLLGEHQDSVVTAETLIAVAHEHPTDGELVLLCGRLAERERSAVREIRAAFPAVWRAASRPATRAWLSLPKAGSVPDRSIR